MTRTIQRLQIDGEKLRKVLAERKLSAQKVSVEIGYNDGYMSKCINNNCISKSVQQLLELKYDIKLEDIKFEKKKVVPTKSTEEMEQHNNSEFMSELYRHLDRNTELMLQELDSIGNDVNEQTEEFLKLIKTLNVTCNIITKNAEQMIANQQKMIYALNIIVNKVK